MPRNYLPPPSVRLHTPLLSQFNVIEQFENLELLLILPQIFFPG